ncbi:uridine kinase [Microbacterium sp. NC79]|uniref:uridine kinase n=1 Tax=Microbacterium sp. NC79 TaxID=2851009 RepID=UPI001C2CAAD9|nr:uridine kinase [Microbacterium sp. NC79]MBV0895272.1 uridine kinase [Microbacterium sp. NC79]
MRLPINPVTTLMRELRGELRQLYPAGRIIVFIDGIDAPAVDSFASLFAEVVDEADTAAFHARLRDFHLSRAEQTERGVTVDEDALRRALIDPFRSGSLDSATSGFQLGTWDADRDAPLESRWVTAPSDAVLIVSGTGVLAPELRGMANWSIWLETAEGTLARRAGRSSEQPYTEAEFTYLKNAKPAGAASVMVDNTDAAAPVQIYRDFC